MMHHDLIWIARQIPVQNLDCQTAATLGRIGEFYAFKIQQGRCGDRLSFFVHPLSAEDFKTICSALCVDTRIRFLQFKAVDLADEGIQHIMDLILSSTCLVSIDLSNNNITNRGAEMIGCAILERRAKGRRVIDVDLSGNPCMDPQKDKENKDPYRFSRP